MRKTRPNRHIEQQPAPPIRDGVRGAVPAWEKPNVTMVRSLGRSKPQPHRYWPVSWQRSRAWGYGRRRAFHHKPRRCRWAISGAQMPVHVLVMQMAGDEALGFLVPSALALTAAQGVAVWTACFRQADGLRDHQQRLGEVGA